jgi:hypothetical protein
MICLTVYLEYPQVQSSVTFRTLLLSVTSQISRAYKAKYDRLNYDYSKPRRGKRESERQQDICTQIQQQVQHMNLIVHSIVHPIVNLIMHLIVNLIVQTIVDSFTAIAESTFMTLGEERVESYFFCAELRG